VLPPAQLHPNFLQHLRPVVKSTVHIAKGDDPGGGVDLIVVRRRGYRGTQNNNQTADTFYNLHKCPSINLVFYSLG
jgi:hypothetical protein